MHVCTSSAYVHHLYEVISMEIKLNIYDKTGKNVEKTVKAEEYEIMFGAVTELMKVVKATAVEDKSELLKTVVSAWDEITSVMSGFFPDVTEDEWKRVKVSELVPVIVELAKYAVTSMMGIPVDPKKA